MRRRVASMAAIVSLLLSAGVRAAAGGDVPPRGQFALGLAGAVPVGGFSEDTRAVAPGLDIGGRIRLDARGDWALRLDAGTRLYGEQRFRLPILNLPGQTVPLHVTTALSNLDLGLQRGFGDGRARPYLFATGGLAHFWVASTFPDLSLQPFEFDYRSNAFAWSAGGGVRWRLAAQRSSPELDLSVAWRSMPSARYVRPADIRVMTGDLVEVEDHRARADLIDVRVTFHGGGIWSSR